MLTLLGFTSISVLCLWQVRQRAQLRNTSTTKTHPEKFVCVYCGSSPGTSPVYKEIANQLGEEIVRQGYGLVYGGGSIGLMGEVARAVDRAGGKVVGIIPKALQSFEVTGAMIQPQHMKITESMHERKAHMAELSSAFIALPGGFGTFEELLEAITWTQLGIQNKPVGMLNINGFYEPMQAMFEKAIDQGFIRAYCREIIYVEKDPEALLNKLFTANVPKSRITGWKSPTESV